MRGSNLTVGAGTVTSLGLAAAAVEAGACFLVSPHFDPELTGWALDRGVPIIPGGFTPTEIFAAWESGAPAVKVFPASVGGPDLIKSIVAPFPDGGLVPTGGITADNAAATWRPAPSQLVSMVADRRIRLRARCRAGSPAGRSTATCLDICSPPRHTSSMQPTSLTVDDLSYEELAGTIDHSLLKPQLTFDDVVDGCALAARYEVASVCVRPSDVGRAHRQLSGTSVAVGTVISFPHGDSVTATKVYESEEAMDDGAVELDMVLNIGRLLSGDHDHVEGDIRAVVEAAAGRATVKVILENAYLTDDQKVTGCQLAEAAGAHYVKTSTGYAPSGATLEDLRLMRASVGPSVKLKAAHGVRTLDALIAVIEAGADRCGATATTTMLDDYRARVKA